MAQYLPVLPRIIVTLTDEERLLVRKGLERAGALPPSDQAVDRRTSAKREAP